ncbi:MAG: pantoate--beta-alanine ligase [Actinomycetota bacterium]|nr:pantoate--beta-alanine ligase [Actinomycetota bacterium]
MERQGSVKTIRELRLALDRQAGKKIGFVPTMGALHEGHLSLVGQARQDCDVVVVSVFVNPLQFGPAEDLAEYPRLLDEDVTSARGAGADIIFAPAVEEMYPEPMVAKVRVEGLEDVLCGKYRPGHFAGVATVVVKLLNIVRPERAYFGAKDWQQLIIVRKVVKDFNLAVEIVAMPTVRDADGLAKSSRNRYLSPKEREAALVLPAGIQAAAKMIAAGERDAGRVIAAAKEVIAAQPGVKLEYFSIRGPLDLLPVDVIAGEVLVAAAVYVGRARLIDNMVIKV